MSGVRVFGGPVSRKLIGFESAVKTVTIKREAGHLVRMFRRRERNLFRFLPGYHASESTFGLNNFAVLSSGAEERREATAARRSCYSG